MIFDTHVHYNLPPLAEDWQRHWQRAQQSGVTHSLVVGTTLETSRFGLTIASQASNVYAAVGIHPGTISEQLEHTNRPITEQLIHTWVTELQQLVRQHPNQIKVIGEIGFDFYRLDYSANSFLDHLELQHLALLLQLDLALEYQLPVSFHVRDKTNPSTKVSGNAYWETMQLLSDTLDGSYPFVLHCASGSKEYIQTAIDMGAYLGIAGNSTYPSAGVIRDLISTTPTNRLVLETDAPYLPPQIHRGQTCQPWMISQTAEFVKSELQLNLEQIFQNSLNLFDVSG